jgi:hypothetical protein
MGVDRLAGATLKLKIFKILYMFVYLVLLKSCHHKNRPTNSFADGGGGEGGAQDLRKKQKLPLKGSDGKRSLSIIHVDDGASTPRGYKEMSSILADQ